MHTLDTYMSRCELQIGTWEGVDYMQEHEQATDRDMRRRGIQIGT